MIVNTNNTQYTQEDFDTAYTEWQNAVYSDDFFNMQNALTRLITIAHNSDKPIPYYMINRAIHITTRESNRVLGLVEIRNQS